jgi:hypothetical protein
VAPLAEVEPDRTTRVAFIMQSRFEKESGVLLFCGEEDQAEMTALINEAEMPALLDAKSTTTQKHKVDSARPVPASILYASDSPAQREPSARKNKRQRRDSL